MIVTHSSLLTSITSTSGVWQVMTSEIVDMYMTTGKAEAPYSSRA